MRMREQIDAKPFLMLGASKTTVGTTEAFMLFNEVKGLYQINPEIIRRRHQDKEFVRRMYKPRLSWVF